MVVITSVNVLFAIQFVVLCRAETCKKDADCGECGYCQKVSPNNKCFYPYSEAPNKDCKLTKRCPDYCKNGGSCYEGLGLTIPMCICDKKHYGKKCENVVEKGYKQLSGIAISFGEPAGAQLRAGFYQIYVFAITSSREELVFFMEASEGGIVWLNKKNMQACNMYNGEMIYYKNKCINARTCWPAIPADKCIYVYSRSFYVPYKKSKEEGVMEFTSRRLGYLTNISVTARYGDTDVFSHTYTKFVYAKDYDKDMIEKFPGVKITTGCGRSYETRTKYTRKDSLSVSAVPTGKQGQMTSKWHLLTVDFNAQSFSESQGLKVNTGTFVVNSNPFSLKFGVYKLEIVVNNDYTAFDQCYIEIVKEALHANIKHGTDITVYIYDGISLSGEGSYDPNQPRTIKSQSGLQYSWSCTPECDGIIGSKKNNKYFFIIPDVLEDNKTYIFTLKVSNTDSQFASASQTVTVSSSSGSGILIVCISNCKVKVIPVDRLAFEVKTGLLNSNDLKFTWTYTIKNVEGVNLIDAIRDDSYPPDMLVIPPNKLEEGQVYIFHVENDENKISARTKVIISRRPRAGSCTVDPTGGIALKTLFTITCSGYIDDDTILVYEYYDKYTSDMSQEFRGRLLSSNSDGRLTNVRLTRGIVVVYIYNSYGIPAISENKISLTHDQWNSEELNHIFDEIYRIISRKESKTALLLTSALPDQIELSKDKVDLARKIIKALRDISYRSFKDMKIGLSIVNNTIASLTNDRNIFLETGLVNDITDSLRIITNHFKESSLSEDSATILTEPLLEQLTIVLLDTIEHTIKHLNRHIMAVSEYDINPSDYRNALQFSRHLQESYDDLGYSNSIHNKHRLNVRKIDSSLELSSVCSITDQPLLLHSNIQNISYVGISKELAEKLQVYEKVTLQSMNIKYNPFWSYRKDISTDLIILKFYHSRLHTKMIDPITSLFHPVDLYFNVTSPSGGSIVLSATHSNSTRNIDELDKEVTVIRMDMPAKSKLLLKFDFNNKDDKIRLVVTEHLRPDYDYVMAFNKIITTANPYYDVPYHPTKDDFFIYIGILAGPSGDALNFTLHFSFNQCLTLIDSYWIPNYCSVGEQTNSTVIHCKCTHLSILSAVFAVPPSEIDPFNDAKLFLTITENALVVIIVIVALLLFLLLCVWARYMDNKDNYKREIIILEDNFPNDPYLYIVGVFTGFRLCAGCDSNVGIQIEGEKEISRSHILNSQLRRIFSVNSDDWFLLRCPRHLGEVQRLHIWHDNTGSSPDWYCAKVIVVDLKSSMTYTFFVEQWLALDSDEYSEALVSTASAADFNNRSRIFLDNLVNGFRNAHLVGGVIAKHPRHVMNRLDKIVILMVLVMLAMLISIAFYETENAPGYDDPSYGIGKKDVFIGLETLFINLLFFGLVLLLFEKSYRTIEDVETKQTCIYARKDLPNSSDNSKAALFVLQGEGEKRKNESFLENVITALRKSFSPEPLIPVSFVKADLIIKRKKIWFISAWIVSIFLITCCSYLVMLYGLKMGYEESKRWATSVFMSLFDQFALLSPAKILLVGILLALVFEYIVYTTNYEIVMGNIDLNMSSSFDSDHSSFLERRSLSMYRPLTLNEIDIWRIKRQNRRVRESVIEMVAVAIFAIIVCCTNINNRNWVEFQGNCHFERMLLSNIAPSFIQCNTIINGSNLNDYLKDAFVNALYNLHWYNFDNLNQNRVENEDLYWTKDCNTKFIGLPVLRQLRAFHGLCTLNDIFNNSVVTECYHVWSRDTEDTDMYTYGWKTIAWSSSEGFSKAWRYTEPEETPFTSRRGATGISYHGGGYIAELSRSKEKTLEELLKLRGGDWINMYTAVAFVTVSLYNVNYNLFTQVYLIAEHLPTGGMIIRSILHSEELNAFIQLWSISQVLFVLFFFIKCVLIINRKGTLKFFTSAINIFQFSLLTLGILSVTFYTIHWIKSATEIYTFLTELREDVFPFVDIFYYSMVAEEINIVLFCGLMVYLLSVWFTSRLTFHVYQTVLLNKTCLLYILMLMILVTVVSSKLNYYLFSLEMPTSIIFLKWSHFGSDSSCVKEYSVLLSCVYILFLVTITVAFIYTYKTVRNPSNTVGRMPIGSFSLSV